MIIVAAAFLLIMVSSFSQSYAEDRIELTCAHRIELEEWRQPDETVFKIENDINGRLGWTAYYGDKMIYRTWAQFDITQLKDKEVIKIGLRVNNSGPGGLINRLYYSSVKPVEADADDLFGQHIEDNRYGYFGWNIEDSGWSPDAASYYYKNWEDYKREYTDADQNPVSKTVIQDLQDHIDTGKDWFALEFYFSAWVISNLSSVVMEVTVEPRFDEGKNAGTAAGDPNTCPIAEVPINFTTGNAYQVETDFQIAGPGLPMGFTRYYNSRSHIDTALGYGWRFDYLVYLTTGGDKIVLHGPDGREDHFIYDELSDRYLSEVRQMRKIRKIGDVYELTEPDGTVLYFNSSEQLVRIEDRNGNFQEIGHDGVLLTYVRDNHGRRIDFHYNAEGLLFERISTPAGDLNFTYQDGNLKSVTYPDNTVRTYLYEDMNDPHNLTGILDQENKRNLTVSYDDEDRAVSEELCGGLLKTSVEYKAGLERVLTDSLQRQMTFELQAEKGVGRVKSAEGVGCKTCLTPADTSYELTDRLQTETTADARGIAGHSAYDERGLMTSHIQAFDTADARTVGVTWHPDYSIPDVITRKSVTDNDLSVTDDFNYDAYGNPDTLIENGYDSDGPITRTTDYTYAGPGGRLTHIDGPRADAADTLTLEYYPDNAGEGLNRGCLRKITDAAGHTAEYENHNTFGRPETVTDVNNVTTALQYDARGRLRHSTTEGKTTEYQYYPTGRLKKIIPPGGKGILAYHYTDAGLLEKIVDQTGDYIKYGYDTQANRTDIWLYDADDTMRHHTEYRYDDDNRLHKIVYPDQTFELFDRDGNGNIIGHTDAVNNHTAYMYDNLNRLKTRTQPGDIVTSYSFDIHDNPDTVTDAENNVTDYDYDDFGRQRSVTSPDSDVATYTYDEADNMKSKTDANGVTVSYSYDASDRLTDIEFPDTSQNIGFVYDETAAAYGKGRLTSAGSYSYKYDAFGRITELTRVTASKTYITRYEYNDRGNLRMLTYPSGAVATYQRHVNERVSGILLNGEILTKNVTYMPFGPEEDFTFGDDSLTVNRTYYDNYYRLERIDAGVLNYQYTYYADGNVKTIDGIPLPGSSGSTTEYLYPDGNRLDHTTGYQAANYTYDNNGNITSDGTFTFVYNQNNRLSEVKTGASTIARYFYDSFGRRVKKEIVASGEIIHYHYGLQGDLLAESKGDGTPLRDYIYQNGSLIAINLYGDQAGVYYVISDHLGTPQQIVDTSGTVVWKAAYLPFGQAQVLVETITCNIRFKGQFFDKETGLHYNINRYYNPVTGRYLTTDPIGLAGGINLYPYVENNPINQVDPMGLEVLDPGMVGSITNTDSESASLTDALIDSVSIGLTISDFLILPPGDGLAAAGVIKGLKYKIKKYASKKGLKNADDIIHVTPDGVALPKGTKHKIPDHYVENPHGRPGSYGETGNGKFKEKLRIDPATPPRKKGPNY